jgi:hypothetical protein
MLLCEASAIEIEKYIPGILPPSVHLSEVTGIYIIAWQLQENGAAEPMQQTHRSEAGTEKRQRVCSCLSRSLSLMQTATVYNGWVAGCLAYLIAKLC